MNRIVEELKNTGVFYIATVDGDRPSIRPFSSCTEIDGKLYICTNNQKAVYHQMMSNNKIAISGMQKGGKWIRIIGKAVRDDRDEMRAAMLADPTGPSKLYTVGDGLFEVFCVENAVCTVYDSNGAVEEISY